MTSKRKNHKNARRKSRRNLKNADTPDMSGRRINRNYYGSGINRRDFADKSE